MDDNTPARPHYGPTVPFSETLHARKYRLPGEDFRTCASRQASALKDDDQHFWEYRQVLLEQRFLPAGRVQSAIGAPKGVTPYNCYVSGTIADSFVDDEGSIMQRATEAAATMRMGGGIGYDFSTLRPRGEMIRKLQSRSSGPISFMDIFDAVCKCTASTDNRRGAQMAVLRIDHPDVEEFVLSKQNQHRLTGFNISLAITDEFMRHLATGEAFPLRWDGRVYKEVDPVALWEVIMRSTWDWAEPGVLFIDTINRMNNLYYCETIAATNPCGEQPLPPFGACLLGSFNLVSYLEKTGIVGQYDFDWDQLAADLMPVVRAMDNVVDLAKYPLPQQRSEGLKKRRMGLGITGLANAGEALGHPYGSERFLEFERRVLTVIRDEAYRASALLAKEKGAFPAFDADLYLAGRFIKSLPDDVRDLIRRHGIRNSHLTSIAPTGTISLCSDNVSSGIEPVFDYSFDRTTIEFTGPRVERVEDYGVRVLGVRGVRARDVAAEDHLAVLAQASQLVDSAVSKTCNIHGKMPWDAFKNLYVRAWETGCKGCTTFNEHGKRGGILVAASDVPEDASQVEVLEASGGETGPQCTFDEQTGRHDCG